MRLTIFLSNKIKKMRPSPSQSAASAAVGRRMRGNDGSMYEVVQDARGVKRWALTPAAREEREAWKSRGVHVRVALRPVVAEFDPSDPNADPRKIEATNARALAAARVPGFQSARAMRIVWSSVPPPDERALRAGKGWFVQSIKWNGRVYEICFVASSPAAAEELVQEACHNYGDGAADSWMEGNILLTPRHELFLELAGDSLVRSCGSGKNKRSNSARLGP